jgi:hypothetical protein
MRHLGCWCILCFACLGALEEPAKSATLPALLYCTIQYPRPLEVECGTLAPEKLVFASSDPEGLKVSTAPLPGTKIHLTLKTPRIGVFTLFMRHADTGTLIAQSTVKSFSLRNSIDRVIGISGRVPDGGTLADGELILAPLLPGLQFRMTSEAGKLSFHDGLKEIWCDSETFTPQHADGGGRYRFRFWQPPGGKYFVHSWHAFQDGVSITD